VCGGVWYGGAGLGCGLGILEEWGGLWCRLRRQGGRLLLENATAVQVS